MAENPGEPVGDNDKARVDAASHNGSEARDSNMASNLPMVVAPRLGAGDEEIDEEVIDEMPGEGAEQAAAPAAAAHSSRFLMLAASVAFAAAFGSFVGSVSGTGLVRFLTPPPQPAAAVGLSTDAMREMKLELTELAAIKSNLDTTTRSTSTQLTKLSDRLDKFDQRAAATEVTGSIATAAAAAASPQPVAAPKIPDRILQDWIVQDVQSGRALVANRYGGMFDVGEGSMLPGIGRIDQIKRQDGQWLVLTERGTITSGR
jgi:hypothetical protein